MAQVFLHGAAVAAGLQPWVAKTWRRVWGVAFAFSTRIDSRLSLREHPMPARGLIARACAQNVQQAGGRRG
jgi:hypothetical protein